MSYMLVVLMGATSVEISIQAIVSLEEIDCEFHECVNYGLEPYCICDELIINYKLEQEEV